VDHLSVAVLCPREPRDVQGDSPSGLRARLPRGPAHTAGSPCPCHGLRGHVAGHPQEPQSILVPVPLRVVEFSL